MRNFQMRRDFSIPPSLLTGRLSTISSEPPPPDALFWELWKSCEDIAQQVLETDYFKGIRNGNLDPRCYGQLINQDAYYCMKGQDSYSAAATHPVDEKFHDFLMNKVASYQRYNQSFHLFWHIKDADGIIPGEDIKRYADFEAYVAGNLISPYLLCAMLPCEYLWSWVASQIDRFTLKDSLYRFWLDENTGFNGAYQMGNFLEEYRTLINERQAISIYSESMNNELKIFKSAAIINKELCQMLQKNTMFQK